MVITDNYSIAVILCIVTMPCRGSWANTHKLAKKDLVCPLYDWVLL